MNQAKMRVISMILCLCMIFGLVPMHAFAAETDDTTEVQAVTEALVTSETSTEVTAETDAVAEESIVEQQDAAVQADSALYDTSVSDGYFTVISENTYDLAPGAQEHEIVLNNASGDDRKVVHIFEVDSKNEDLEVMPGYYGIDKLDPDNLALDGVTDKSVYWKDAQLSKTVAYYEGMGYNVVGAMNTALAYDSNAPYGYMVWDGVVLGTPEVHKGAQTYLAIDWEGNCELRSMSTPLTGNEKTAISANFGWLVKDGALTSTSVERTSSDASRSMIGIKADGTLVFCQVDGRNAPVSTGLSNYEMGEAMLALGCVNAVNCDGGGSSTFISKRAGESANIMRSIPSDGSERATINSVILVSTAGASGVFDKALIETKYDYIAPGAHMSVEITGLDTKGFTMDIPADVTYRVAEEGMGSVENGVFTAGTATGTATIEAVYNDTVVGSKVMNIVHPEEFGFASDETVLPYGKEMELEVVTAYGADDWFVCIDGAYTFALSDEAAATLNGNMLTATSDESFAGVNVTVTYLPDTTLTDIIAVTFGKGSEILFDFEDGSIDGWMGFQDAKQWSIDNGVNNTLVGSAPLAGQFNEQIGSTTFLSSVNNGGKVKNGEYALAWSLDNTDATFANWSYNVLFYVGDHMALRDVANGQNATTLGMWLYIPENAPGLAFQSQLYTSDVACKQSHFTFTTASGTVKNLNSCTEADIPESRWVYASIDLTAYDYIGTPYPTDESNSRSPSIIRTYVKPTEPAVITFYIDDITLDYSSAVDDRVLPTISNVAYATEDTSLTLDEGAAISGSKISFSANVADNAGLNNATGTILVDGVAVESTVSGGVLFCDDVKLNPGVHTVTFEIQDKLGNLAKVTRTFTISGDALVTLSGHNDSGAAPEYDSVYYADINVAAIENIDALTTTIYLQTANTWEPQGIQVADGFEAEYALNEKTNELTVTVKRVGETTLTGAQTLVSLPIRLWSWNGIDNVTGEAITPEAQFATGYCPIVELRCDVVYGVVTFVEETDTLGAFGGSLAVATNLNDNVNPWHFHDSELTVLNLEATCTTDGYTGRTYCETCKAVVDWGTKTEATGHDHQVVDSNLVCDCGDMLNTSGLVKVNGKAYYLIAGTLQTGWQSVGTEGYCYADPATNEVYIGCEFTVNGLTYTANEDGVTTGAWDENYLGRRFSYGPQFYKKTWVTIDGEQYYFGADTYAFTGYHQIRDNENNKKTPFRWFLFGEDGVLVDDMKDYYGFLDVDGVTYFLEGGIGNTYIGTTRIDDDGRASDTGSYYYLDESGKVLTGKQWVGTYLQSFSKYPLPTGNYEFDENGKMLDGIVSKEDGTYYYEMGKPVAAGWVKDGEDYYVFTDGGKAMVGRNWVGTYLNENSKDPYKTGYFIFAADGKLANGVVEGDDGWYYCVAGVGKEAGLVCIDGQYYYAEANGKLATGRIWVGTYGSNGLLAKGYYEFGENGAMLSGVVVKEEGTYYYEKGRPVDTGWLKVGDDYYVFTNGGKALTGLNWVGTYLTQTSRDPYKKGNFYFTADGKLANGVVGGHDGWYYYEAGVAKEAGLVKLDGIYYLAETDGKLATGRVWVGTYASNGLLPKGYYEFGTDGAMLQGVVEKDDGLYYYELGNTRYLGLIQRDGEYYYVNEGGKLEIGRVWVGSYPCNGLVAKGYYEFGEDGAMLNGFEMLSDGLYFYAMGVAKYLGLVVIDSDLYYIEEGGKVMTGTVYVGTYASNGLLPKGNYTFDETGKFVK